MDKAKTLTVYKASAGSGKTFTLATEYMRLLVDNPHDYKTVLAVTFTNKATEEMKTRILSQLYGVWKKLPDSQSYVKALAPEGDVSPDFLSRQAGTALHLLLHNYGHFRIETIDSFFQSVLRNLARELDLAANLRIGLNDSQVEEQAVDGLIEGLVDNDEILAWIIRYIKGSISEDKSWNVIGQIKAFGKTIFKDFYKQSELMMTDELMNNAFFERFATRMRAEMTDAARRMTAYADAFDSAINAAGLTVGDFSNGTSGVAGFFVKLANGVFDNGIVGKRVLNCADDAEQWVTKKHPRRQQIVDLVNGELMPLLHKAMDERPQQWRRYKSAELTLSHLSQLRLLKSIAAEVRKMNVEANRFLLSDTQHLLMSLIDESDTPFIYEKIGTQLKHIMIDEFQDTSTVQWRNFKVLLHECMSHDDSHNIIVGDVKQSIYRWRDSDWRLLNSIESQFEGQKSDIEVRTLAFNYRSKPNVVNFNNALFTLAAQAEHDGQADDAPQYAPKLLTAYADVAQRLPEGKADGGYVSVELLPNDNYVEVTLERIEAIVTQLQAEGIRLNDICVLVRRNEHIPIIARHFMDIMPDVKVVSDQAFRLDASLAVNIIVNAMRIVAGHDDRVALAVVAKGYQNEVIGRKRADGETLLGDNDWLELLPKAFVEDLERLRTTPLYALAEEIYYMFDLKRLANQSAYVCAFFDKLGEFTEETSTDIDLFLDRWEAEIGAATIQADEIDGIRIMSIHKSKGLEFDNVIVPFCDWTLERSRDNILWCSPKEPPYDELPLIPVDYNSSLKGTVFEDDYLSERLQNSVDNLNLLYVALTRAGNNLFILGKRGGGNTRSALLEKCLPNVQAALQGSELTSSDDKQEPMVFTYGAIAHKEAKQTRLSDNVFLRRPRLETIEIETFPGRHEFRQSNKSHDFIGSDDDQKPNSYLALGNVLHNVLSSIETSDDLDRALRRLEVDGIPDGVELTTGRIAELLRSRLTDERVVDWFSGRWHLYNECTLLHRDKATGRVVMHRPDRVMVCGESVVVVDFKFGKRRNEHLEQVRLYMDLLKEMGHSSVSGYLWYVFPNDIVEVAAR